MVLSPGRFPDPCNFFFENGLYPRPGVFRMTPEIRASSYEMIFRELNSGFSSAKEVAAAEQLLDDLFLKTARAIIKISSTNRLKLSGNVLTLSGRDLVTYIVREPYRE
jgi:hypothetical protein